MTEIGEALQAAVLWGRDHGELGAVGTAVVGDRCALGLSRGRFRKGYPHVDANEDAVAAASDGTAWLVAVADGHSGSEAAEAAMGAVLQRAAGLVSDATSDPEPALRVAFESARAAIAGAVAALDEPRRSSRTALTLALASPTGLHLATRGDTVAVLIRDGRADLLARRVEFLGPDADLRGLQVGSTGPTGGGRLVLASDGLYDFLGPHWLPRMGELAGGGPPEAAVSALMEEAFRGGSGDNVAVACLDLPREQGGPESS